MAGRRKYSKPTASLVFNRSDQEDKLAKTPAKEEGRAPVRPEAVLRSSGQLSRYDQTSVPDQDKPQKSFKELEEDSNRLTKAAEETAKRARQLDEEIRRFRESSTSKRNVIQLKDLQPKKDAKGGSRAARSNSSRIFPRVRRA